jgi:hypothetical protein
MSVAQDISGLRKILVGSMIDIIVQSGVLWRSRRIGGQMLGGTRFDRVLHVYY